MALTLRWFLAKPYTQAGIDKNNRLIKGHVFLWKDGQMWEELWDLNGEIAQ